MRISLLSALFAVGTALAAEIPVSQPVYGPAPFDQRVPAVASDGDRYLVVWTDRRAGLEQTFATRVSGDGTVLDPRGIRVAVTALSSAPHVIWGGSSWFVLSNICGGGIRFIRVGGNGAVLDAEPRVFPIATQCSGISEATDGRRVVVGYTAIDTSQGYGRFQKHALIIDSDGAPVADIYLSAGTTETGSGAPAIAWDGTSFVAVWDDHAARFDAGGLRGASRSVLLLGHSSSSVRVASDGKDFLVVRGGLQYRLGADLNAQYVQPLPFLDVQSILWTGSEYVVFGLPFGPDGQPNRTAVNVVRLDRDGQLLGGQTLPTGGSANDSTRALAVATNGRNLLTAWHDLTEVPDPYAYADTYASVVALPSLTAAPRKVLSLAANWQIHAVTAASQSTHLTVWQESKGLFARRHRRDGAADGAPIRLAAQATSTAIVFNGSDFIVATVEPDLMVRRLPAAGELRIDREVRIDAKSPRLVTLATSGNVTMLAWLDGTGLYAARVAADGSLLDSVPLQVTPVQTTFRTHRISIAPNRDGEFLVVWGGLSSGCNGCSPTFPPDASVLRAARVTSTMTLLDPTPITVAVPASFYASNPDPGLTLFADHPSVTSNGQEWLVVWNGAFREREEIRGRRIARNGTLLDGTASDAGVLIAQKTAFAPTVAWTGTSYVLTWYEGLPTYRWITDPPALQRMHAATFERLGGPLSNERTLGEAVEVEPLSIAVANGVASIAYVRLAADAQYGGVTRAFLAVPEADSRQRAVR